MFRVATRVNSPRVGYWLLGSSTLVFGVVVVGGLTRLTESGLSITQWKPVQGILPPLNKEQWKLEYSKYKDTPEYRMHNTNMDMQDFKSIYLMEYSHRMLGRVIGITFALPAAYLILTKRVSRKVGFRLFGISSLIGFQGFLGWWMVKSGLGEDLRDQGGVARVSQYRLAAHLGTAFVVYSSMLWTALDVLSENKPKLESKALARSKLMLFKGGVATTTAMVFITALSGAFVAGLDAGLIYNEFPYMGNSIVPSKNELLSPLYKRSENDLIWRNMFENPTTAQFDHRCMATSTFVAILLLQLYSWRLGRVGGMSKGISRSVNVLMAWATCQVALGISTLIYLVPTPLAASHQAGSLALLTSSLVLLHKVK
jgi:cytochrome c oxidase assembly protein subunit 15